MFYIFAGSDYYPSGGWDDYKGSSDSVENCLEIIAKIDRINWYQIVDASTRKIVKEGKTR